MKKRILCIGGTDSSTGAGVTADLETLNALGAKGVIAITSVTAQSDEVFFSSHKVASEGLVAQLEASKALPIDAIKIGMLPDKSSIQVVSQFIDKHLSIPSVMDPVFSSSSGGVMVNTEELGILIRELFPKVSLLTPNALEAESITCIPCKNVDGAKLNAEKLIQLGARAVLVKGGHLSEPNCTDIFFQKNSNINLLTKTRLKNAQKCRGTGCRLSTSIAYYLACGDNIKTAVEKGSGLVEQYIINQSPLVS